jgi:hypothetical protein
MSPESEAPNRENGLAGGLEDPIHASVNSLVMRGDAATHSFDVGCAVVGVR